MTFTKIFVSRDATVFFDDEKHRYSTLTRFEGKPKFFCTCKWFSLYPNGVPKYCKHLRECLKLVGHKNLEEYGNEFR